MIAFKDTKRKLLILSEFLFLRKALFYIFIVHFIVFRIDHLVYKRRCVNLVCNGLVEVKVLQIDHIFLHQQEIVIMGKQHLT